MINTSEIANETNDFSGLTFGRKYGSEKRHWEYFKTQKTEIEPETLAVKGVES